MKLKLLLIISLLPFFVGCSMVTPRVETVVDTIYVPKQCPTFNYKLKIKGSKYIYSKEYNNSVVVELDSFLESLEKTKLARQTFNKNIIETNKVYEIKGIPTTNNYRRITKRVFVDRKCPQFKFKPKIKARKITDSFKADKNTTYVVIKLDNLLLSLEKFKLARKKYQETVNALNKKVKKN